MEIYQELSEVPADFGPSVVALGNFDGVHLGHQRVLERIVVDARSRGHRAVAVTFDPHPAQVHSPEAAPPLITGPIEKLDRLRATGLDAVLVQHYTLDFARQTPEEYVRRVFAETLHAATVVVGRDVRFGWQNSGDLDTMRELGRRYGFAVEVISDVGDPNRPEMARWSSTTIRALLAAGEVEEAATLLGRPHAVRGTVVHGNARGRDLGFPTANLGGEVEGLIPADGVYAGWVVIEGDPRHHPAAISVGSNPTFAGDHRRVEAHVIDRPEEPITDFDLYGRGVRVEFVRRLRGIVAYQGIDPLIAQMHEDVQHTREALGLGTGR